MQPAQRSIRLVTHLFLTHLLPLVVVTGALATTLFALTKMTRALSAIITEQLGTVDVEERAHRAAWEIEVALRHERIACEADRSRANAGASIAAARSRLGDLLASRRAEVPARLLNATDRYLRLADRALGDRACDALLDPELDRLRAQLDEDLTNVWIERVREFHGTIGRREEEARRTGALASAIGLFGGAFSWLAAAGVAWATARAVTAPLARLGQLATRLGEGNFSPLPLVRGTREVVDLARELERMRVRLLELDQLKRGFVASVSHELRTPLAKLREALSLLADGAVGPLNAQQERVVQLAQRACEREVRTVSTLLDLSRMRSGSPLRRDRTQLRDILAAAAREERPEKDERDVTIEITGADGSLVVEVDASLVEHAVANLMRNAVSVSAPGQVVRVACATEKRSLLDSVPRSWATVTVSDDGPGVAEAIKPTLFGEFVSRPVGDASTSRGVGLGLAFAREVARAHGGDVRLVDSPRGASFVVWLPLPEKEVA